jgi:hypothetical protein
MRRICSLFLIGTLSLFVAACSDSDNGGNGKTDGKVPNKEAGPPLPDTGPPPTELVCNNDCQDFVLSKITLPDSTTASKIGWDYNNDGTKDNALGSILGALSGMAGSLNIQESVDDGVNSGGTLVLLRVQADDFKSDDDSKAQAWTGESIECCADPSDSAACATEAKTKCFAGSTTFYPAADSPKDALFKGKIAASDMQYGPAKLKFILPFGSDAGNLDLNLKAVYILGKMAADGKSISEGILAGAISKSELDNTLIPKIAEMLNKTLNDPDQDQQVKDTIATLFDTNKDKSITKEEVANNSIIKTFLSGDVDVDNDGENELSLGVGFEAASCTIDDKGTGPKPDTGTTPDAGAPDA